MIWLWLRWGSGVRYVHMYLGTLYCGSGGGFLPYLPRYLGCKIPRYLSTWILDDFCYLDCVFPVALVSQGLVKS
jgi:hypothetical protein